MDQLEHVHVNTHNVMTSQAHLGNGNNDWCMWKVLYWCCEKFNLTKRKTKLPLCVCLTKCMFEEGLACVLEQIKNWSPCHLVNRSQSLHKHPLEHKHLLEHICMWITYTWEFTQTQTPLWPEKIKRVCSDQITLLGYNLIGAILKKGWSGKCSVAS